MWHKTKIACFQAKRRSNSDGFEKSDMTIRFATMTFGFVTMVQTFSFVGYAQELPKFSAPLDCVSGPECFLQNMMDLDPTKGRLDPLCGLATYDGHKGTDIRVRSLKEMNAGVNILSMADGIVLRARDGTEDHLVVTKADFAAVKDRECGNGVVIDHSSAGYEGWSSQICHMANGSLMVKPGDTVKRGQPIGRIGLSGSTQFPHVHVTVRKDGKVRDLVTNLQVGEGCNANPPNNLLSAKAWADILSRNTPLIDYGFSNGAVNGKALLKNETVLPTVNTPLVFYAKFINLRKDDEVLLEIKSGNEIYASSAVKPLAKHQATYTAFAGRKTPGEAGKIYTATVKLMRDGKLEFEKSGIEIQF